ncbi:hypothetical protein [Amycolatopsis taiwanensis]|uniref:Lipoprotein n=1 Tax=Amycolatopsis taiwanensis TaxID=342230 RepID=A0A9W6VIN4_9PSEU|nr:hypothetical protein [Amycolatopsis taiwanensis]GLY67656.1 hypothetical protein Atai01_42750 [Amycolatopsis taiwanensis]
MGLRKSALPVAAMGAVAVATVVSGCSVAVPGAGTGTGTGPASAPVAAPPPVTHQPEIGGAQSPDPPIQGAPNTPAEGSCGTFHAQNGLNLQVVDLSASGVDCAEAERLIRELPAWVVGRLSGGMVSMSVQSLVCAPDPRGGAHTTCNNQQKTIHARVVP